MSPRWKLSRHHRTAYGDVVQDFKGSAWYTNLEMGQSAALRDAQKNHADVGPTKWVKRESDPETLVWELDQDHWYTLVKLAEELEGG